MPTSRRVLVVDLNNFALYPTPPVGILTAVLRQAGHAVSVFSPLSVGVGGMQRERAPRSWTLPLALLNDRAARSCHPMVRSARDRLAAWIRRPIVRHQARVVSAVVAALEHSRPDIVLISTYLSFRDVCAGIAACTQRLGIPLLIGGPYFAQRSVIDAWIGIEGLTALVSGELELELPRIVDALCDGIELPEIPGLHRRADGGRAPLARALPHLDAVPHPDFSDFAWNPGRPRIVPVITGRGCAWGACSFCSDITSTAGRRWRSRSAASVLDELAHHRDAHRARHVVFTDLKLNGDLAVWRALHRQMQSVMPGARWIGAVHVGREVDNGLSRADLQAAADSGCVRLTTGLETGSQRLADRMRKGTSIERTGAFLQDATAVGISCRCTLITGYPGETAEDVDATVAFLRRHQGAIERVSLNRLQVVVGTVLERAVRRPASLFQGIEVAVRDEVQALVGLVEAVPRGRDYRRALDRLIETAAAINRQPLSARACDFDRVM